jgi:hypothetical protein
MKAFILYLLFLSNYVLSYSIYERNDELAKASSLSGAGFGWDYLTAEVVLN